MKTSFSLLSFFFLIAVHPEPADMVKFSTTTATAAKRLPPSASEQEWEETNEPKQ